MRAHQSASSASSEREKCTRPLVVGPSPVITPSRTMVRAWAAVSRQDGSRDDDSTDFSTDLGSAADIVHFQISSDRPAFSCGRKGVVNDSIWGSRLFSMVAD